MDPMLQFFNYDHLPPHLQAISIMFHNLATDMCNMVPRCAERTVALRKLLESKDCAVRAVVFKDQLA